MTARTTAEQLAEVQEAITAVLTGGQEVQLDGQRVRNPDLDVLHKREDLLLMRLAREQRGSAGAVRVSVGTQRR